MGGARLAAIAASVPLALEPSSSAIESEARRLDPRDPRDRAGDVSAVYK